MSMWFYLMIVMPVRFFVFQYAFQFLQSFFKYIIGGLCSEWTASNSTTDLFLRIPVISFKDEGKQTAKRLHSLLGKAET